MRNVAASFAHALNLVAPEERTRREYILVVVERHPPQLLVGRAHTRTPDSGAQPHCGREKRPRRDPRSCASSGLLPLNVWKEGVIRTGVAVAIGV